MWYDVSNRIKGEFDLLLNAIRACAKKETKTSLFLSAIESDKPAMIRAAVAGIKALVPAPKVDKPIAYCWCW